MKNILMIAVFIMLAVMGYRYLQPSPTISSSVNANPTTNTFDTRSTADVKDIAFDDIAPTYVDLDSTAVSNADAATPVTSLSGFSCDSRQHCSQMTSCAEATFFIQHCSNTKMDGNRDGIPCEQQWCN